LDTLDDEEEELGDTAQPQYTVGPPIVINQLHIENKVWDEEPDRVNHNELSEEVPGLVELCVNNVLD
jgi:hypothetical protein